MSSNRIRDFLFYIGISVLLLAGIFIAATLGVSKETFSQWYAFILFSLFLYGQFILNSKSHWKHRSFWVTTVLAVIGHSAIFIAIVRSGRQLGVGGWIVYVLIEMVLLMLLRAALYGNKSADHLNE
jgi:peptidoglycan/LPS O-acetylase OafA/YrhL